ncbi:hypothetical protein DSN97_08555 [Deferribacteraceae bacterium V6Fe1]|nr:hypothetical protein DSN97_08555 [Deferribacteraceae bacterium V6Fe1]
MDKRLSENASFIAKKYKYKEMILKRKLKVNVSVAKKLIGPDCAYHLYSDLKNKSE